MTLRLAFIGAGQMARQHLNAVRALPIQPTIVGVQDLVPESAEELAALAGCPAFVSREALFADARPDVVHVCTPPETHFEAASAALEAGAHVYVEKPFARTVSEARALLDTARARGLLVCAGHQLLRDRAFESLVGRAAEVGPLVQVDSHFAFRPGRIVTARSAATTLARYLTDILPHPLYTLVSVLERSAPDEPIELEWVHAEPGDLQAVLLAGPIVGRLSVSLQARPVASSLQVIGTRGSYTCDFVRSMVVGAGNPGTEALEKVLSPMLEGAQLLSRTGLSVLRRFRASTGYPGLPELIAAFYAAVAHGGPSPVSPAHLLAVTDLFERLVARIEAATRRTTATAARPRVPRVDEARLAVVTGAGGFLGAEICRALPRVRGIARTGWPHDPQIEEWFRADLSREPRVEAVAGADVVVHAAAETAGGYDAHQRNTIDATRHLLDAMHAAGVRRLVLVSSLSVLRPPRTPWESQDESTPRPAESRRYGPYTWGKSLQEELVEREAAARGIAVRIVRPGALIDARAPDLPGLVGRRLFGRWHLGLGRPGLPIAACDVERCAGVIAWCATHFEEAPPIVNFFDPTIRTRADLLTRLRAAGWTGRVLWVPITLVAWGLTAARTGVSIARGRRPETLAVWSILRPRHYDARLATRLLEATQQPAPAHDTTELALHA